MVIIITARKFIYWLTVVNLSMDMEVRTEQEACTLTTIIPAVPHRRRKWGEGGGSGGACPHKLQVVGALPPQPEPSSICCISPSNWSTTWNLWTKVAIRVCCAYPTAYFSLNLSRYSQKYLPASPIGTSYSSDSAKWAWFESNVGVVKKFHTRYAHNPIFCPHNLYHLPTPMCLSNCLCYWQHIPWKQWWKLGCCTCSSSSEP